MATLTIPTGDEEQIPEKKSSRPAGKHIKKKEMKERQRLFAALRVAALPVTVLYLELMLRICSGFTLATAALPGILLTAVGLGFVLTAIPSAFGKRWAAELLTVLCAELLTVWFLITYFTNDTYLVFMGPLMVLAEAGNVAGEFSENVKLVILGGIGYILLFHVPVILQLVFGKRLFRGLRRRGIVAIVSPVLGVLLVFCGWLANNTKEELKRVYTVDYTYDTAVRTLGAVTAFAEDIYYGTSKGSEEKQISFAADPAVPGTPAVPDYYSATVNAQPKTPEPTDVPGETADPAAPEESGEADGEPDDETAEPESPPEPIVYGYNVIDLDFNKLIEGTSQSTLRDVFTYCSTLVPTQQNEYTGMFKGKNLILITAESFSEEVIDPERTPTLYRLAHKGISFDDFYVPLWAGSTSTGEYEFLMGNIPTDAEAMQKTQGKNLYYTMGNCLQREGYYSLAVHNGNYDYYSRHKTHTNLGYSQFLAHRGGLDITWQWPASDEEMAEITLPMYIDEEPFSIYYLTISGHFNHTFNGNQMAMKYEEMSKDWDYYTTTRSYLAAQMEVEAMLNMLIDTLEEKGILDNTVICLCADHYPYGLEKGDAFGNGRDYLADLYKMDKVYYNTDKFHSRAILWCRELEDREPITVSKPTWAADLLPTLLNLFGIEYDSRLLTGRDALAEGEGLVVFADRSWKTDVGYYDKGTNKFTPTLAEGEEPLEDYSAYVETMKNVVSNRFSFSKAVVAYDIYGAIFDNYEAYRRDPVTVTESAE